MRVFCRFPPFLSPFSGARFSLHASKSKSYLPITSFSRSVCVIVVCNPTHLPLCSLHKNRSLFSTLPKTRQNATFNTFLTFTMFFLLVSKQIPHPTSFGTPCCPSPFFYRFPSLFVTRTRCLPQRVLSKSCAFPTARAVRVKASRGLPNPPSFPVVRRRIPPRANSSRSALYRRMQKSATASIGMLAVAPRIKRLSYQSVEMCFHPPLM